jgi:hypothetical protein
MIRSAIRDKARMALGETTASFWTDAQLNTWINDGIRDISWRTKCLKKDSLGTSVTDQGEYALLTMFPTLYEMLELYFYDVTTTSWLRLTQTNRKALDKDIPGWMSTDSSLPQKYIINREENYLYLWPPPSSDYESGTGFGVNYIKGFYCYEPTDLSTDGSTPEIPATLHDAIVEYVKIVGFESRGMGDRANNSRQLYISMIKDYVIERSREDDEEIIMHQER